MSEHLAAPGECLASLSETFGFPDFHTILDHPENSALKTARPNPNMLVPGDLVHIPDPAPKKASLSEDLQHEIRIKQPEARFKLKLMDDQGVVFAGKKFNLKIGSTEITGNTDGDGMINEIIPPGLTSGELTFFPEGRDDVLEGYLIPLSLGNLRPPDTTDGQKMRLQNLGYPIGPLGTTVDERTQRGIRMFQRDQALTANATLDAPTTAKLKQVHDGN